MKALVTGGAGFIGSHIVDALLAADYCVNVLDNLSTGQLENLQGKAALLFEGDVTDLAAVQEAVEGCDVVFHHAALVSVPQSIEEPQLNYRSNVAGTFNVFEAARLAGVKRVVYASSSAVYGEREQLPVRESDLPKPISPYATAKLVGEELAHSYNTSYGMEIVALRYMNVFGPRQNPSSPYSGVLSIFCQRMIDEATITIHGDGEQTRDFIYVDDVVAANILAATVPFESEKPIYNIGRGQQTTLNEIVAQLGLPTGQVRHEAARLGDIRHSYADIGHVQTSLGFRPKHDLASALAATLAWYKAKQEKTI